LAFRFAGRERRDVGGLQTSSFWEPKAKWLPFRFRTPGTTVNAPETVVPAGNRIALKPPLGQPDLMSKAYTSNDEFFRDMRSLIETWCDRRCLYALATLLPAFTSFNGMTDGWGELVVVLERLTLSKDTLSDDERKTVAGLAQAAEKAARGR
jgi:hypothetical protein